MIETLITLYVLLNKYGYTQQTKIPSQGSVVVSERQRDIPQQAKASWYGKEVCRGRIYGSTCKTANGEIFNEEDLAVANRSLPFGTVVEFTYNGRNVTCRVNDRGPYVAGRNFDLSLGCFRELSNLSKGVINVEYKLR